MLFRSFYHSTFSVYVTPKLSVTRISPLRTLSLTRLKRQ